MEISTIVWLCAAGACFGILTIYYNSTFLGKLVRALIAIDATTPESAMTLKELNIKLTPPLKYALRPDSSFSTVVIKTDEDKYYISPKKVDMAKAKYRGKEASISFVIISILIILIAALALSYILPEVVDKFFVQTGGLFGGN